MKEVEPHLVHLIALDRCKLDEGVFVEKAGKEFAVFQLSNPPGVYVIDNACPHANGNLSAGDVKGSVVTCPWHAWKFHVTSGKSAQGSVACVKSYAVEIRDNDVYVKL